MPFVVFYKLTLQNSVFSFFFYVDILLVLKWSVKSTKNKKAFLFKNCSILSEIVPDPLECIAWCSFNNDVELNSLSNVVTMM